MLFTLPPSVTAIEAAAEFERKAAPSVCGRRQRRLVYRAGWLIEHAGLALNPTGLTPSLLRPAS
jgi:hypothetical protein